MKKKRTLILFLGFLLFLVTLSLYWQTRNFDFINYDDYDYIHYCEPVTNGLSLTSIAWAFGREPCSQTANWHPITTLSWMFDVSLFGLNSGAMHLHNTLIHSINGVLLFSFLLLLLQCIEKRPCISFEQLSSVAIVAAFIGAAFWSWHPLRVESVAWVSSRKDVLSILFLLPGLMAYLKVVKGGNKAWLAVSAFCYILAYCSKPTAVVYPLLAVLLEYIVTHRISWRQNELLVYLMLVLMAVTFIVQDVGGATAMVLPIVVRIENAIAGLGHYLLALVCPIQLAIFYKYEVPVSFPRFIAGSLFIISIICLFLEHIFPAMKRCWHARHENKMETGSKVEANMLAFLGVSWFLLALAPVSGLIQVGLASCADRYTYLSGIGLSIVLAVAVLKGYSAVEKKVKSQTNATILFSLFGAFIIGWLFILVVNSSKYIEKWKNTRTVFAHAARVTAGNYLAYCNAGAEMLKDGQYADALKYFLESAKYMFIELEQKKIVTPYKDTIAKNLAIAFSALEGGVIEKTNNTVQLRGEAVFSTKVRKEDPLAFEKIFSQGLYAHWKGLDSLALQYFEMAIEFAPQDVYLWRFKGYSLQRMEREEEALVAYKKCYSLRPEKNIGNRIKKLEKALALKRVD